VGNPEAEESLRRTRVTWKNNNIKIDIKEIAWNGVD
jgi:hypothetical protein